MKIRMADTAVHDLQEDVIWARLPPCELPWGQVSTVILQGEPG